VAGYANVLLGDFFYVDGGGPSAEGFNLVRIEADPHRFAGAKRTFYASAVGGTGIDGREPLPTAWAQRYFNGGSFSGATELIVWRDLEGAGGLVTCGSLPTWFPLGQASLEAFDEQEHVAYLDGGLPPFPLAANRTPVSASYLAVPYAFGWFFFDLQKPLPAQQASGTAPQAWMGAISGASRGYRIGVEGTPLDNGCAPGASAP
jgi:hypothetical protein